MKSSLTILIFLFISTLFLGCGDEVNKTTYATKVYPTYPKVSGRFIDSGVDGLEYTIDLNATTLTPDAGMNLTKNGGSFDYFYGEVLLFKIGGIHIGNTPALSIVTPKDIVSFKNLDLNTSIYAPEVNNRVRLLMSLDSDGTPANGITISPETRAEAKNWTTPDYTLNEADFTKALNASTNDQLPKIFTKVEAETHFEQSLRCVYSGAYRGSWILPSGEKSGFVGVMIQADGYIIALGDGQDIDNDGNFSDVLYAAGKHNMDNGTYYFSKTYQFDAELGKIVSSELEIEGDGSSSGYNEVSGTFVQYGQKGEYTAYRVGEGISTSYRYTGNGYQNNNIFSNNEDDPLLGLFTFYIESDGTIIGLIHDARTNAEPALLGKVDFTTGKAELTLESGQGHTISGTIDFTTNNLYLTWFDADNKKLGYLKGIGCQLQPPSKQENP